MLGFIKTTTVHPIHLSHLQKFLDKFPTIQKQVIDSLPAASAKVTPSYNDVVDWVDKEVSQAELIIRHCYTTSQAAFEVSKSLILALLAGRFMPPWRPAFIRTLRVTRPVSIFKFQIEIQTDLDFNCRESRAGAMTPSATIGGLGIVRVIGSQLRMCWATRVYSSLSRTTRMRGILTIPWPVALSRSICPKSFPTSLSLKLRPGTFYGAMEQGPMNMYFAVLEARVKASTLNTWIQMELVQQLLAPCSMGSFLKPLPSSRALFPS